MLTSEGGNIFLVFLELFAVFDTTYHKTLLEYISAYGAQKSASSLAESNLTDCFQWVVMGGAISEQNTSEIWGHTRISSGPTAVCYLSKQFFSTSLRTWCCISLLR